MDMASKRLHDLTGLLLFLVHLGAHLIEQLELLEAPLKHEEDRRLGRNDLLSGMKKRVSVTLQDGVNGVIG